MIPSSCAIFQLRPDCCRPLCAHHRVYVTGISHNNFDSFEAFAGQGSASARSRAIVQAQRPTIPCGVKRQFTLPSYTGTKY